MTGIRITDSHSKALEWLVNILQIEMGIKAVRLAHQVHQGVKPSDLPVETLDVFSTINLKTAEEIGLQISDMILLQAKKIIR